MPPKRLLESSRCPCLAGGIVILAWVAGAGTMALTAETGQPPVIAAHETLRNAGKEVTVQFFVRQVGYNSHGDYVELYSQIAWDHPANVFVRLAPSIQSRLAALGIYKPGEHFSSRTLRVRGVVDEVVFGEIKRPCVYVTSLDQIEIVKPEEHSQDPAAYETIAVGDFVLKMSPKILAMDPAVGKRVIERLTEKTNDVKRVLPAAAYAKLKGAVFWVHWDVAKPGMAYHPNKEFLERAGIPVVMWQGVEIQNVQHFLDWTATVQPWAILHELAHKYHHEVLGAQRQEIIEAHQAALSKRIYSSVKHVNGKDEMAYATADPFEYFAELTEAYFGKNDFYPFTRDQLKSHDPVGYEMIETCWGVE